MDAEFLAILLAVRKKSYDLITMPQGSPSQWLRQLSQEAEDTSELDAVCAGLNELELITQFTSLCLGKAASLISQSDSQQSWRALADQLGLASVEDIETKINENCQQIASVLEKNIKKNSNKQS